MFSNGHPATSPGLKISSCSAFLAVALDGDLGEGSGSGHSLRGHQERSLGVSGVMWRSLRTPCQGGCCPGLMFQPRARHPCPASSWHRHWQVLWQQLWPLGFLLLTSASPSLPSMPSTPSNRPRSTRDILEQGDFRQGITTFS